MASNKFIVINADHNGIKVKFEPSITKVQEIEEFMKKNLPGTNTWKVFGDLIWFYRSQYVEDYDSDEEEDEDSDKEDDYE